MTPRDITLIEHATPERSIYINPDCDWEFIDTLEFEEGIGIFPQYRSMLWDKKHLHRLKHEFHGRIVIAFTEEKEIIGYIGFSHTIPEEGWPVELSTLIYELGSIEVSRNWRRMGVARKMLDAVMADDVWEDFILALSGFSWHWDLEGAVLSLHKYRTMLMEMFREFGFRHYYTNEPNVLMDSANMFMARVGSRVCDHDQDRFIKALFSFSV